jgi:hypothetical protein
MITYDIEAKKTKYGGIVFRSQLEATWAAFFDQLCWPWEYEPCTFDGWVPDFKINALDGVPIYVEVKPIEELDKDVCKRMSECTKNYPEVKKLLLVGTKPITKTITWEEEETDLEHILSIIHVGWGSIAFDYSWCTEAPKEGKGFYLHDFCLSSFCFDENGIIGYTTEFNPMIQDYYIGDCSFFDDKNRITGKETIEVEKGEDVESSLVFKVISSFWKIAQIRAKRGSI